MLGQTKDKTRANTLRDIARCYARTKLRTRLGLMLGEDFDHKVRNSLRYILGTGLGLLLEIELRAGLDYYWRWE